MKPLRAFPLPINVGTDICRISRIFGIVASGRGSRFASRVLTPRERRDSGHRLALLDSSAGARGNRDDAAGERAATGGGGGAAAAPTTVMGARLDGWSYEDLAAREPEVWKLSVFLAGRFAAKEAAIKAHTHRRLSFHDVEVERRTVEGERLGTGPPVLRIRSEDGEAEDESALVSISHDGDFATAVCIGHDPSVR